ncbi:MAG: hypothetical protein SGI98_09475 [Verrucomicrobiota bacterium]|nr:hypothetical protein [Verrucomicrobiota bacterium]
MISPIKTCLFIFLITCTTQVFPAINESSIPKAMTPELFEVFPMEIKDGYVVLSKTILLGEQGIIPAGTIILNLHAPVLKNQKDTRSYASDDRLKNTFTKGRGLRNAYTDLTPEQRAANKRTSQTEWFETEVFVEALRYASKNPLSLSYVDPVKNTIETAPLMLFEGMFVAEDAGKITVLAIAQNGRAAQAGFLTGDIITTLNNKPLPNGVNSLVEEYSLHKKMSGTQQAEMIFSVNRKGEQISHTLKAPVSLNSSFF